MTPFYVTGLPRSRTAWLSVALTYGPVRCSHDSLVRLPWLDHETVAAFLTDQNSDGYSGISDSGLPMAAPTLPSYLPGPIVIVWRSPEAVAQSLCKGAILGPMSIEDYRSVVEFMWDRLQQFALDFRETVMIVDYEQLSEEPTMQAIWNHIAPTVQFPKVYVQEMQRLQIEVVPHKMLDGAQLDVLGLLAPFIES